MEKKQLGLIIAIAAVVIIVIAAAIAVSDGGDDKHAVRYTATFISNGGSSVSSETVESGDTIAEPAAPTRDGFVFAGWYTDSALTDAYDFSSVVSGDIVLYAKWTAAVPAETTAMSAANAFKSTYSGVYGSTMEIAEGSTDDDATLILMGRSMSTMDYDGTPYYIHFMVTDDAADRFNHMKKDLHDTMYTFMGSKLTFLNFVGYDDIYACTNDVAYNGMVTFTMFTIVAYHDDLLVYNVVYKSESDASAASNAVSPSGILAFGQNATMEDNALIANAFLSSIGVTDKVTITESLYTVTFVTNGGTNVASQQVSSGNFATYDYSMKDGYKFDGWYSDAALTKAFDIESTPIESDITLYAKWTVLEERTVTFQDATVTASGASVVSGSRVLDQTRLVISPDAVDGKDAYVGVNGASLNIRSDGTFVYMVDGSDVSISVEYRDNSGTAGDSIAWSFTRSTGTLMVSSTGIGGAMAGFADGSVRWGGNDIVSVVIGAGITSVGDRAFSGCTSLSEVSLGADVASIGWYAFSGCTSLKSIVLPDACTQILGNAFEGCYSLTSVTLGTGLSSIGDNAFSGDVRLFEIVNHGPLVLTAGDSVTSGGIAAHAISVVGNAKDAAVKVEGDYAYAAIGGTTYLLYYVGSGTTVSLPSTLGGSGSYAVYDYAFYHSGITSLAIPSAVTGIGAYAFAYSALESAFVPGTLKTVGDHAFFGCSSLTKVTSSSGLVSISDYMFGRCSSLTSIDIPETVASIGSHAFLGCYSLVSMVIPDSVEAIGDHAFYGCSSLSSLTMGSGVKSIGASAFTGTALDSSSYTVPTGTTGRRAL